MVVSCVFSFKCFSDRLPEHCPDSLFGVLPIQRLPQILQFLQDGFQIRRKLFLDTAFQVHTNSWNRAAGGNGDIGRQRVASVGISASKAASVI